MCISLLKLRNIYIYILLCRYTPNPAILDIFHPHKAIQQQHASPLFYFNVIVVLYRIDREYVNTYREIVVT